MPDESFWLRARREMMLSDAKINLNAGTLSPTPRAVFGAAMKLRTMQAENPSDFCWRQTPPLLARSRDRLANYLHCNSSDLVLLPNVTFALNIAINSLRLPARCEILTTDHEYGAMLYALERFAEARGITIRKIKLPYRADDPDQIVEAFATAMSANTKLVFFSHCTTTTGCVLPAKRITSLARQRGAMVMIDGAHAPGMIPVDLDSIDADFYGANCHKWMMAPAGAGFLHVASRNKSTVAPLITSWGWKYDRDKPNDASALGGNNWQANFEFNGTLDRTPQMVLGEALDFRQSLGGDDAITARYRALTDYARKTLGEIGLKCVNAPNPALTGCLLSFDFPCKNELEVRDIFYNEFGIECPVTVAAGEKFLRVSCAWFNTKDEIDRLAAAVKTIRSRAVP